MSYGIRISDEIDGFVTVDLPDLLSEIQDGDQYYWSILYLYASGHLGEGKSIPVFEDEILEAERGFFLNWRDLNVLAKKFYQVKDIVILGCIDKNFIKRYETDEEMYDACDIVIVMFDSSFWELFTKDKSLIERWEKKFKEVEWLIKNE